jgi:hypothetical protein
MRSKRCLETRMLGYKIERLDEYDDAGPPFSTRFEVLCPRSGAVLGDFADVGEAKRFVLVHELRAIRAGTQRLNKIA